MRQLIAVVSCLFAATLVGSLTVASAARLDVNADNLAVGVFSGIELVEPCDLDGVHVAYELVPGDPRLVAAVTVIGIDKNCRGETIAVVVSDAAGQTLATVEGLAGNNGRGENNGRDNQGNNGRGDNNGRDVNGRNGGQTFDFDTPVAAQAIHSVRVTLAG